MARTATSTGALTPEHKMPEVKSVISNNQIARMALANWERWGNPWTIGARQISSSSRFAP